MSKKLAVALGLREKVEKDFKNMVDDMHDKFKGKQGLFQGTRVTFDATEGNPDQPTKRQLQIVSSTVDEQLKWLKDNSKDFLDIVLSIERTNSTGVTAELFVKGQSWGMYSTLELLRLKGIVESKLRAMFQILPIRPETMLWSLSTDPVYEGREVYQTPIEKDVTTTTIKRIVIVDDPHQRENPNIVRTPVTQPIDTPTTTGNMTKQLFSGAITNRRRAEYEVRLGDVLKGIIAALEDANSAELQASDLGDKFLGYLFK